MPRYFELLRNGLVESACVYTSMTGFSYFYLGLGNDIGYDSANGYPNSIPCDQTPHYGSGPGFAGGLVDQAVDELEVDWDDLCRNAALKRAHKGREAVLRFLASRGFPSSIARRVAEEVAEWQA